MSQYEDSCDEEEQSEENDEDEDSDIEVESAGLADLKRKDSKEQQESSNPTRSSVLDKIQDFVESELFGKSRAMMRR